MSGPDGRALPTVVVAFVTTLWAGMLAVVSFLATPVFQAPSLSLPVAPEICKVTLDVQRSLNARVGAMIAGVLPQPSWHHLLSASAEAEQPLLLRAVAVVAPIVSAVVLGRTE